MSEDDLRTRAERYAADNGGKIVERLGFGNDGEVWKTDNDTAVKVFERRDAYDRELQCYLRLREYGVGDIDGFNVPNLIGFDGAVMAIEIEVVDDPFLLDFGKAHVDCRPEYMADPMIMAEWAAEQKERWGSHWPIVQRLIWKMESMGI